MRTLKNCAVSILIVSYLIGCDSGEKPLEFKVFLNSTVAHFNRVELVNPSGELAVIPVNPKGPEQNVFSFSVKTRGTYCFRVINDYEDCVFAAPIDIDSIGVNSNVIELIPPDDMAMNVIFPVLPGMRGERGDDLKVKVTKIDDPCGEFGWSITDSNPSVNEKVIEARIYALTPGPHRFQLFQNGRPVIEFDYLISGKNSSFTLEHTAKPWSE